MPHNLFVVNISWMKSALNIKFLASLFCLALFFAISIKASDFRYYWWTTAEGLPQNSVNSLVQTREGYLWIATFGGLVRFDGVKFTVFNTVNAPELKSQRITALHEDRAGVLWIATETGEISCLQDGKFHAFDDSEEEEIYSLYADTRGYLWTGGANGARRYKLSENQYQAEIQSFERVTTPADDKSPKQISTIIEASDGDIWLNNSATTLEKPSRILRWRENAPIEIFDFSDYLKQSSGFFISDIAASKKDLWVAERSGLYRFDGTKFIKELEISNNAATNTKFTRDLDANLLANLDDGILHLGSNSKWEKTPVNFSEKGVQAFFSDREGNLWLGTNTLGLSRLKQNFIESFDESRGVANNQTAAVLEDSKGNLWIAGFGLHKFENNRFIADTSIPKSFLISLAETRDGTLMTGGYDVLFARRPDGSIKDLSGEIKQALGTATFAVKAIFEDSYGNLWLGFREHGLLRREVNGNYKRFTTEQGLIGNQVQFITESKDGAIWFGILGGANRFENDKFTSFTTAEGFANNNIRDIRETADGSIYFGTYGGGLSRLKNGTIKTVTVQNGLFDNVVSRILIDENDNFWMLGNQGIFTIAKSNLDTFFDGVSSQIFCRSFGTADGMLSAEGNGGSQPAGWIAKDKKLWFPTIRGYVAITPPPPEKSLPNAAIEEIRVNNRSLDLGRSIEIQPNEQNLEIVYTGISFNRSNQLQFRYKLEGFDENWTEAGNRRTAYYAYPPSGEYVFTVQAANADGVWNENSAKISLKIFPKFYRTWWFWLTCFLLAIALFYLIFSIRLSRLNRAKQAQELFSRRLIQVQEEERKRIAADLHDSLSQNLVIIKNRAMISLSQRDDLENVYEQIEEIAEAADESLTEVREIATNLRPFQIDRLGFTNAVEALVRKATTQNLQIEARIDKIDHLLKPEMEINLFRILQEGLNNIVKHSEATEALLEIQRDNKNIRVNISDNGKGYDLVDRLKGGFGLMGMQERARILGCVPIIETGLGKGTTIRLNFTI